MVLFSTNPTLFSLQTIVSCFFAATPSFAKKKKTSSAKSSKALANIEPIEDAAASFGDEVFISKTVASDGNFTNATMEAEQQHLLNNEDQPANYIAVKETEQPDLIGDNTQTAENSTNVVDEENIETQQLLLLPSSLTTTKASFQQPYTFAVVPKNTQSDFFTDVEAGCLQAASKFDVTCHYIGTEGLDPVAQLALIDVLIDSGKYAGLALSVIDKDMSMSTIAKARDAGMAVVTFDSDALGSERQAYIGTDNFAFGDHLGKVLLQLDPAGGTYGIISANAPNLKEREEGLRKRLEGSKWKEASSGSPKHCMDDINIALEQMWEFARDPDIDTVIPVGGWPMYNNTGWKDFVNSNRNKFKTLVVGDAADSQMMLLKQGYVSGLVGQLPFIMGFQSIEELNKIVHGQKTNEVVMGTNMLQVLSVPLILPPLTVDANYLHKWVFFGYLMFGLITMASVGFAIWTGLKQKDPIVKASQPPFLIMICMGTLIMGLALIPLSFDDNNSTQAECNRACVAIPWLLSIGFTVCFSALYSKTWRLNKVMFSAYRFQRIIVQPSDVLLPFVCLLTANIVILLCWTLIDPLYYARGDLPGTDDWNRVITTYGHCTSSSSYIYVIPLCLVNVTAMVLANYQAYKGRVIETAFSESKYIFAINVLILQASIFVAPMIALTKANPRGFYIVMVLLISSITLPMLMLIFVPKVLHWHERQGPNENQGRQGGVLASVYQPSRVRMLTSTAMSDTPRRRSSLANSNTTTAISDTPRRRSSLANSGESENETGK